MGPTSVSGAIRTQPPRRHVEMLQISQMVINTIKRCSGNMRALQEVEEDVLQAGGDGSNSIDGCGMLLRGFAEALHDGIGAGGSEA